uniref:Uncharacterized protein n=1 Tax=Fagus sylvatica TaxID=28930 RepID=A0A2N9FI97_FAGSY
MLSSSPPKDLFNFKFFYKVNSSLSFLKGYYLYSQSTCEANHHHRPQETHPTAKPAAKPCCARSQRSGGHPSVPISAWMSGLAPNEFELAKKGITGSGARPGGGGAVPFGG